VTVELRQLGGGRGAQRLVGPGVYPNFGELGPDSYDDETLTRLRDLIAT
jgi:hypothetical protein